MTRTQTQNREPSESGVTAGDMEITSLVGREVYTGNGVFIGEVSDVKVDFETQTIDKLTLDYVNNTVVDIPRRKSGVLVPYRWVQSVGDIILVTDFVEAINPSDE